MITPPQEYLEGLPVSDPSGCPGSSLNSLFTGCSLRFLFPEVSALFFFSLLSAISVGRVTTERRIRRPTRQLLARRSRAREMWLSLAPQARGRPTGLIRRAGYLRVHAWEFMLRMQYLPGAPARPQKLVSYFWELDYYIESHP